MNDIETKEYHSINPIENPEEYLKRVESNGLKFHMADGRILDFPPIGIKEKITLQLVNGEIVEFSSEEIKYEAKIDKDGKLSIIIERIQPTNENINVSAIIPEIVPFLLDKVSQNLFRYLDGGTYSMNVEKSGSADSLTTIVTLDFDELEQNPALTFRGLTPFEKRLYVAAGALQQAGNKYISATQIYKQMGGKGNPADHQIKKIIEACTKMMATRLGIDNHEEAAKYPKYKEFQRGLFYLFPVEIVENVSINGRTTDFCLHFLKDELPLFTFARLRKQITEYTPEQWFLPFSMTDDNILLDDYLRSRTARMRRDKARSKNHSYNGKMLYSTIYENCGIDTKKKRFDATKKLRKLLDHYKATGIIIDYQEGKDGITITV